MYATFPTEYPQKNTCMGDCSVVNMEIHPQIFIHRFPDSFALSV